MARILTEHERAIASLEWAAAQPCGWCRNAPRAEGDHFCPACREKWDARGGGREQLDQVDQVDKVNTSEAA